EVNSWVPKNSSIRDTGIQEIEFGPHGDHHLQHLVGQEGFLTYEIMITTYLKIYDVDKEHV
ncbi:hypothetical protein ACJX0J_025734, partial [Zea mays]